LINRTYDEESADQQREQRLLRQQNVYRQQIQKKMQQLNVNPFIITMRISFTIADCSVNQTLRLPTYSNTHIASTMLFNRQALEFQTC